MRTPFRLPAVTLVLAAALAVSGCTPDKPSPVPSVSQSGTPLFASDEEALAAAEEAYAAYLAVVDNVLQSSGDGADSLTSVASGEALEQAAADAAEFRAKDLHTAGNTGLRNIELQDFNLSSGGDGVDVIAYVCEDATGVDLLNASGVSIVGPNRADLTPFEVSFGVASERRLILTSRLLWEGEGPCT